MKTILLIVFLLTIDMAFAATIHGTIYDLELKKVSDVIVEVNSVPKQRVISKDGTYSFALNPGKYKITANHTDGTIYKTEEEITVEQEGDYVLDLFLFPSFEEEEELIKDTDIVIDDEYFEQKGHLYVYFMLLLIISTIFLVYYKRKKFTGKKEKNLPQEKESEEKTIPGEKADLNTVIEIIREQGGRTTQKEIRKKIPLSEAKISLMITELESKGKIKKIKKGRGNILILNE